MTYTNRCSFSCAGNSYYSYNTPNHNRKHSRRSSTRTSSNAKTETETENEEVPNIQRHIRRCQVPPKRMYTQRTMLSRRSSNKPPLHDRAIRDR